MVVVTFPAPLLRRWRQVSCEHFHRERPRPRGLAGALAGIPLAAIA
ncbi:hypothetical protein FB564_1837 [Salinispora arenicola]|uniref:Uncharacterized protein n=1 Tax=Salinispora arenicola TaxID=168697 RepID=A0A542XLJ8_SALAC|nr:hypothetical protein FB564_1837 [Salinispora arenicola]